MAEEGEESDCEGNIRDHISATQSVVQGPAESTSLSRVWWKCRIAPRSSESEFALNKILRCFTCTLKFESHCSRYL